MGPKRSCFQALTRRSIQMTIITPTIITENTTTILINERRMKPLSSGVTPTLSLQT